MTTTDSRGSRRRLRSFCRPSTSETRTRPPSNRNQIGVICGAPPGPSVETSARARDSSNGWNSSGITRRFYHRVALCPCRPPMRRPAATTTERKAPSAAAVGRADGGASRLHDGHLTVVDLRWLRISAAAEAASLLLLLVNHVTVHLDIVTSLAGPVHGLAWLATIAIAFLTPIPPTERWTSVVPGVGGLLAVRLAARAHPAANPGRPLTRRARSPLRRSAGKY
jgi:hypothetical protein